MGYLTLLGASLVGAPWVPRAGLPVVGAVLPRQAAPAGARLPATAAVTPAPDLHHPSATVPNTATATSGGTVSRPGQPNPTTIPSRPATTVGGAPTTTTPPATTTSLPGRSGTAPGHGRKP